MAGLGWKDRDNNRQHAFEHNGEYEAVGFQQD